MAGITPLADRVLVKRSEPSDKSAGGIWIPENAKEKLGEGTVIVVGEGKRDARGQLHPIAVKPQQKILFSKYVGVDVELEGEEYIIMGEHEILGIVT